MVVEFKSVMLIGLLFSKINFDALNELNNNFNLTESTNQITKEVSPCTNVILSLGVENEIEDKSSQNESLIKIAKIDYLIISSFKTEYL